MRENLKKEREIKELVENEKDWERNYLKIRKNEEKS